MVAESALLCTHTAFHICTIQSLLTLKRFTVTSTALSGFSIFISFRLFFALYNILVSLLQSPIVEPNAGEASHSVVKQANSKYPIPRTTAVKHSMKPPAPLNRMKIQAQHPAMSNKEKLALSSKIEEQNKIIQEGVTKSQKLPLPLKIRHLYSKASGKLPLLADSHQQLVQMLSMLLRYPSIFSPVARPSMF